MYTQLRKGTLTVTPNSLIVLTAVLCISLLYTQMAQRSLQNITAGKHSCPFSPICRTEATLSLSLSLSLSLTLCFFLYVRQLTVSHKIEDMKPNRAIHLSDRRYAARQTSGAAAGCLIRLCSAILQKKKKKNLFVAWAL